MMNSPPASDASASQEGVFDSHLKKITAQIGVMLNKLQDPKPGETNPNFAVLESFSQILKAPDLPRDLFALKAQAKSLLEKFKTDNKSVDSILTFADYLDHELTLLECFVSKAEEVTQNYLKEKRGWYEAAIKLGPLLTDCRSKNDLTQLKTTLLDFCKNQLVYMGRHSKTFKPKLEAIANAIPSNECLLAASAALSSQSVQSLRQQWQKSEAANASLSLELTIVVDQLSTLKIEKEERVAAQREAAAKREAESKKGLFDGLFNFGDDDKPPAPPIVYAQKAAAKASAPPKPQAKLPVAAAPMAPPTALRMEYDKGKVANTPNSK